MTETIPSQTATFSQEQIEHISNAPVPAREIFFNAEQLDIEAANAIDSGTISVVESSSDSTLLRTLIHVEIDDLTPESVATLKEADLRFGKSGLLNDFSYKDEETVKSRMSEKARQQAINHTVIDSGWYLQSQDLRETIEKGFISEAYTFVFNDKSIPLVNFTEQPMTPEQVEDIRSAVEKVANVTGGKIFDITNMISIDAAENMGKNNGSAQANSGTIRISADVVAGKLDEKYKAVNSNIAPLGSYLECITVHELGHLIDLSNQDKSLDFGEALGWTKRAYITAPDTPDVEDPFIKSKHISRRTYPAVRTKVMGENGAEDVSTIGHFGAEQFLTVKPVTKYGNTDKLEHFAESFIPYVLDEGRVVLDALTHNAVANVVHATKGADLGPIIVTAAQIDPRTILKSPIAIPREPITYKAAVYFDGSLNAVAPQESNAAKTVTYPKWEQVTRTMVDDYGNEVSARPRVLTG